VAHESEPQSDLVGRLSRLIWSFLIGRLVIGDARYVVAQNACLFLKESRYPFFLGQWILILFVLAILVAHLYAWARQTLGAGPGTAVKIGFLVGFAAGFPDNFAQACWSSADRAFPLG
jgi:hypothetical protein